MEQSEAEMRGEEQNIKNTLQGCKFVKTVLMILVILGHSVAFWSGTWFTQNPAISSEGLKFFYGWINSFHIFAFTLVAGYIYADKRREGAYNKFFPFLYKKIKRLLVPYIFVAAVWVAPISAYFFHWDDLYLKRKYLLCIEPSQLWFLWMLFWVFVISWPLWRVFSESRILGAMISLAFYRFGTSANRIFPNVFCIWTACQYIFFFYVGIRIRLEQEENRRRIITALSWWQWGIADIVLYVVYSAAPTINIGIIKIITYIIKTIVGVGLNFFLHLVGAIMAFTVLQEIAKRINWEQSTGFNVLSSCSMPMYLFHQQLIYFSIVCLNGKVSPWINASINFLFAFTLSLLLSKLLMHFKLTRFLVGEK